MSEEKKVGGKEEKRRKGSKKNKSAQFLCLHLLSVLSLRERAKGGNRRKGRKGNTRSRPHHSFLPHHSCSFLSKGPCHAGFRGRGKKGKKKKKKKGREGKKNTCALPSFCPLNPSHGLKEKKGEGGERRRK